MSLNVFRPLVHASQENPALSYHYISCINYMYYCSPKWLAQICSINWIYVNYWSLHAKNLRFIKIWYCPSSHSCTRQNYLIHNFESYLKFLRLFFRTSYKIFNTMPPHTHTLRKEAPAALNWDNIITSLF